MGFFGLYFDGGGFFSLFLKYLRWGVREREASLYFFHILPRIFTFTTQDFELFFFSLSFEL